jgi:hypothetical protein
MHGSGANRPSRDLATEPAASTFNLRGEMVLAEKTVIRREEPQ